MQTPKALQYFPNVSILNSAFNVSGIGVSLNLISPTTLTKTYNNQQWASCYVGNGPPITSGRHYFQFRIVNMADKNILFGIANTDSFNTNNCFVGACANSFGCYLALGGETYHKGANAGNLFPACAKNDSTVGMLIDMDMRTVTMFLNGEIMGTAFGSDKIPAGKSWYPVVSLYTVGQVVHIEQV